ncbi:MAG: beta-galactosidase [Planctomycetes bacterium]|nr:beta-galactosidase [Planctomycetota bacterium]
MTMHQFTVLSSIAIFLIIGFEAAALGQAKGNPGVFKTGPGYIWIEGEDAASETFKDTKGRWTVRAGDGFSGGAHVTASASADPSGDHTATWKFKVETAGEYELWARIGWRHWNDHEWKIDSGQWNVSTSTGGMFEFIKVPVEGGVAEASWITYGKVKLDAGDHSLSIRLKMPEGKKFAQQFFDCFCLSRAPFVPAGKYRPDEAAPLNTYDSCIATKDWWPFQPVCKADEKPLLDFAFLNEPVGVHGFVTMKDGDLFFADGTPVRFWGTNASYWGGQLIYMDKLDAERFADHLAHLGVNCVRIHVLHQANSLMDSSKNDTQHMDSLKLDRMDYLLYALLQRGIYVNIDLMYHRTFLEGDKIDEELIAPKDRSKADPKYNVSWACGAAAFWHPRAIELNLAFYKEFLTRVNPYTKKSLVQNPQMAMVNVQNEQSIFWGTTNLRKGRTAEILDELFTGWLKKKYGTNEKLAAAWQIEGKPSALANNEKLDGGTVRLGQIVMSPNGSNDKRVLDQKHFLYDMETGFYQNWIDQMHAWGVKCPIITSNWSGSGNTTRLVIQASALGEIVDRHNYFTKPESMIAAIGKGTPMCAFDRQAGRAFCISEWNHGTEGLFGAETIPVMATVAAIQGWGALFHFSANSSTWTPNLGGLNTVPQHAVLYPFASMIWRRGDVATGPVVFERRRDPEYQFGPEKEARVMSTDPAAAAGAEKTEPTAVPPEIIAIGRVQNAYVDKRTPDLYHDDLVKKNWDQEKKVVTSAAGDVQWRYGEGWIKIDSARTQGGFGAIAGKKIDCKDVTIQSPNVHATILVSSLDGKPIGQSKKLAVVAVGRSASNAVTAGAAKPSFAPPCFMEPVLGSVSIKTGLSKVTAVSATGYKIDDVPAKSADGTLSFDLAGKPQVVYYLLWGD